MAKALVSDELWAIVEPLIPMVERRKRSGGLQGPGGGCRICGVWSELRLRRSSMVIARPRSCF